VKKSNLPQKKGADLIGQARRELGERWGLERQLSAEELGKLIGLTGNYVNETILEWMNPGKVKEISGPAIVAIEGLLNGYVPIENAMLAFKVQHVEDLPAWLQDAIDDMNGE